MEVANPFRIAIDGPGAAGWAAAVVKVCQAKRGAKPAWSRSQTRFPVPVQVLLNDFLFRIPMQSAKDSFYVALRDRLAALDPTRTVTLDGATRPAVVVTENASLSAAPPLPEAFYLTWLGAARAGGAGAKRPQMRLEAKIEYHTSGTEALAGVDRGRSLASLDLELARILSPHFTAKKDHTLDPATDLGSVVLWSPPAFEPAETRGAAMHRSVKLAMFFWPEVELP
jgi:hypothetical protein